jgi:TatD DNase family protein
VSGDIVLTDSHAHLTFDELRSRLPEVVAAARAAGVARIMTVSCNVGDFDDVVRVAEELDETWAAIGVHPHEASAFTEEHASRLRELCARPRVVAVGEIGLDYHYDHSPRDVQRDVFRRQLRLAREVGKPVVVHSREAEDDTALILEEEGVSELGGVLHCFTSRWELARRALDLGLCVSFSGIVTFKNAADLRDAAHRVPADRLMVETDSPYLAPLPHRGRWPNEPALVRETASFVAELRGVSLAELAATTTENFERTFLRGHCG